MDSKLYLSGQKYPYTKVNLISEAIFLGFNSSKKQIKYLQNSALAKTQKFWFVFSKNWEQEKLPLKSSDLFLHSKIGQTCVEGNSKNL